MEGNFNFWSITLLISIGQGVVLSSMIIFRPSENLVSSRLLFSLIAAVLIVNIDYFFFSSSLYMRLPSFIGISFGLMYVFGPLFYLYMRSVADISFTWRHIYWLHFLPWVISLLFNSQFYLLDGDIKIKIASAYLQGKTPADGLLFYVMNSLQVAHLSVYLIFSFRFLNRTILEDKHLVPISRRINWLRTLLYANFVFVFSFISWFVIVCVQSVFIPPLDYINTLICSTMVFMIAYKLVFNPEVLTPNFDKKYKSSSLTETDSEKYVAKLIDLMENDKIYTEPELKLYELADQLVVTPHTLSQIINAKFGKSFIDFINEYRVAEFKKRISEINGSRANMLSIALEVGFNSKSAFNAAFKKITNQTPSAFKKGLASQKKP